MDVDITSDDEERGFNSNDVDDLVRQMRYISRRLMVTVERIEIAIRNERNPRQPVDTPVGPPSCGNGGTR
jgi:hypothetical protein